MTPAEKEAYANCTSRTVHLCGLRLNHPAFTEPLHVVRDNVDHIAADENGVEQTWLALWFDDGDKLPISEEPDPTINIKLDNVSASLWPYLLAASTSGKEAELTVYPLLYDADTQTTTLCGRALPMTVRSCDLTMTTVTIRAGFANPANIAFPSEMFTADRFPGLPR